MGGAVAVAGAAVARARRRVIEAFRQAGATSSDRAIAFTPREHRVDQRLFATLRRHGVIVEAAPDRFHLDEDRLAAWGAHRRRRALGLVALLGGAAALIAAFS